VVMQGGVVTECKSGHPFEQKNGGGGKNSLHHRRETIFSSQIRFLLLTYCRHLGLQLTVDT